MRFTHAADHGGTGKKRQFQRTERAADLERQQQGDDERKVEDPRQELQFPADDFGIPVPHLRLNNGGVTREEHGEQPDDRDDDEQLHLQQAAGKVAEPVRQEQSAGHGEDREAGVEAEGRHSAQVQAPD